MLSGLQEKILREEVVDYVMEKFEAGLLKELENMGSEMGRIEKRKCELEGELANLTRVIASGQLSPTIMTAIAERIPRMLRLSFSTETLADPNNQVDLSPQKDALGIPRPRFKFDIGKYAEGGLRHGVPRTVGRQVHHFQ